MTRGVPVKIAIIAIFIAVFIAVIIFALDLALPAGVAGGVPYVLVILLGIWLPSPRYVIGLALICTVLTILGYLLSPAGGVAWMELANRGLALVVIWISASLILQLLG